MQFITETPQPVRPCRTALFSLSMVKVHQPPTGGIIPVAHYHRPPASKSRAPASRAVTQTASPENHRAPALIFANQSSGGIEQGNSLLPSTVYAALHRSAVKICKSSAVKMTAEDIVFEVELRGLLWHSSPAGPHPCLRKNRHWSCSFPIFLTRPISCRTKPSPAFAEVSNRSPACRTFDHAADGLGVTVFI